MAKFADMGASNRRPRRCVRVVGRDPPRLEQRGGANYDVIFISVKPYTVAQVLEEMRPVLTRTRSWCPSPRASPSPPWRPPRAACRWSASCPTRRAWWAASPRMAAGTPGDHTEPCQLFNAIGKIHEVKESLLNAVTGVSGRPAYIFQVIEAMSERAGGPPLNIATDLAAQTVMGAAKMVLETGKHPGCSRTASVAGRHLHRGGARAGGKRRPRRVHRRRQSRRGQSGELSRQ